MIGTPEARYAARKLKAMTFAEQQRRLNIAAHFNPDTLLAVMAQARKRGVSAEKHLTCLVAQYALR